MLSVYFFDTGNAQHSANADLAAIASYEEAFQKISNVTKKNDINVIVDDFIRVEDENFALFNYVNELNSEVGIIVIPMKLMLWM